MARYGGTNRFPFPTWTVRWSLFFVFWILFFLFLLLSSFFLSFFVTYRTTE
jgi:hypothetical protein